jgi:hypothetical protein
MNQKNFGAKGEEPQGLQGSIEANKEGAMTKEEVAKTVAIFQEKRNSLTKLPPGDTNFWYKSFAYTKQAVETFDAVGVTEQLAENHAIVTSDSEGKNWKDIVANPSIVQAVKENTQAEKAILKAPLDGSRIIIPEGTFSKKSQASLLEKTGSSLINEDLSSRHILFKDGDVIPGKESSPLTTASESKIVLKDNGIDFTPDDQKYIIKKTLTPKERNTEAALSEAVTNSVSVNTGDTEAQKVEWMKAHPEDAKQDTLPVNKMPASFQIKSEVQPPTYFSSVDIEVGEGAPVPHDPNNPPVYRSSIDIDLGQMEADALASKRPDFSQNLQGPYKIGKPTVEYSPALLKQDFKKEAMASPERLKDALQKLDARREKAEGNLEAKGLTGIAKALDVWGKANPKLRLGLAVALAGASIVSGTALFGIVGTVLSAGTFAANDFAKKMEIAEKTKEGMKTGKEAVKSLVKGIVLAVGTSALFGIAGDAIQTAGDKVFGAFDAVKDHFAVATPVGVATADPSAMAGIDVSPASAAEGFDTSKINGLDIAPDASVFKEYTIQSGDNLTTIIRDQVIDKIPGTESLTPFQKKNMVQNLLEYANGSKDSPLFSTLNQFTDYDLIKPGQTLDLAQIKDAISSHVYDNLNGETLLDHARKLAR